MAREPTVLETPRLTLRELGLEDLDAVAEMLADRDVMRFFPAPLSRDEALQWIERQQQRYAEDGHGYWLAVERATGVPVGQAGVMRTFVEGVAARAIGYIVHRPFWRRGFATEAAVACRDFMFDELGLSRAMSLVRPENLPSIGVARKVGMRIERRTTYARYEHFVFSMTRAERDGMS